MNIPELTDGIMWIDCPHCEYEHVVLMGWDTTTDLPFGYYICDDERFHTHGENFRIEESDGGE